MNFRKTLLPAVGVIALGAAHAASAGAPSYIALGDSYAYGFTTISSLLTAAASDDLASLSGYQGYVAPVSQYLGISEQNTYNLAIPGETLSSFLSGGNAAQIANLNYSSQPSGTSQSTLLGETLAKAGGTAQDITIQLGGNDLLGLAESFSLQPPTAPNTIDTLSPLEQAELAQGFTTFDTGYTSLLKNLKAVSPNVYAVGYFDPFTALDSGAYPTTDPFYGLGSTLLPELNANIEADANAAGVKFVNIAPAFAGQVTALSEDTTPLDESELKALDPSYVPSLPDSFPDYHPNAQGYQVIAQQIEAQTAVPESSAEGLLLLGLPFLGLVFWRRRERQR
jgi:lysophospholipase L1-like esterase